MRFLERIQSHISSVLGSEDCRSSVHSQMQEPLLRPGESAGSVIAVPPLSSAFWWYQARLRFLERIQSYISCVLRCSMHCR